jgi:hypothetical protein
MADAPASLLSEERAILAAAADAADQGAWRIAAQIYGTLKVHALLAAVEAVLEKADDWEASSDTRALVTRGYAAECFRAAITAVLAAAQVTEAGDG